MIARYSIAFLAALACAAPARAVFQDGVDVSTHQGTITWSSVKSAGIKFAYTKATEGVDFVDNKFTTNMAGAKAAGVLIGPYHYARPDSNTTDANDAINEADDFIAAISPYYQGANLTLRPVMDVEESDVGVSDPKTFISNWVVMFANRVHTQMGVYPVIYASSSYAATYFNSSVTQSDFWVANWKNSTTNPPTSGQFTPWSTYKFWQWTATGTVSGISGNVDRDVFNGTMQQLSAFIPDFHAGDFDGNGIVDGRDYIRWRNTKNTTANPGTAADADLSGTIDNADYTIWRANFGKTYSLVGSGAGSALGSSIVPEPTSAVLVVIAAVAGLAGARRRQRR